MIKSISITTINSILTTILVLLQCVNIAAAQIIPRVEPDTKIYASNPSSQTITVTASYAPMGQNPQNGARQTVTIEPFETVEVPNALSAEGSAYVASSGAEPVLLASVDRAGSGYNAPALPAEAANNRDPQAFILQTGEEKVVILSGNSTSTNTMTFEARGPEGDGYVSSEPLYGPPNIVTSGNINGMLHQVEPPNSSCTGIPKYSDESKAGFVAVYQNPATLDERMQPGQTLNLGVSPEIYVSVFGNGPRIWLSNPEFKLQVQGDSSVDSIVDDFVSILYTYGNPAPPISQDAFKSLLKNLTDGNSANGELNGSLDSFLFEEGWGIYLYDNPKDPNGFTYVPLTQEGNNAMRARLKSSLVQVSADHPEWYGGTVGGLPSLCCNSWSTRDAN